MKVAEFTQLEQEQKAEQKRQEKQKEKEKQEKKEKEKDLLLFNLNNSIHGIVSKPFEYNKKDQVFDNEPRPEYEDDDNDSGGNSNNSNKKLLGFSMDNGKSMLFSFPDFFGEAEAEEKRKAQAAAANNALLIVDNARKTPDQSMEEEIEPRVEV
jgi:hypothetical protein